MMLDLIGVGDTRPRTLQGWVSRLGTLCGAFAILLFVTGCPCQNNADCDDGAFCNGAEVCNNGNCEDGTAACAEGESCDEEANACVDCLDDEDCADDLFCNGDETCADDGTCAAGTNPCSGDTPVCDEATDGCVECLTDDDCTQGFCSESGGNICVECITDDQCDDGLFCTGSETCVNAACVAGSDPCDAGEVCDELAGECVPPCVNDADCDDAVFCNGSETCGADGVCVPGTNPCPDNGVFCDGTESCDEGTAMCESSGDPCAADETCDEASNSCLDQPPCDTDADCDDGLFCNGTETCGADGICDSGTSPCDEDAGEVCNEDLNTCAVPPPPLTLFTLGVDNLSGTSGNDAFDAPLVFNPPTATNVPSIQNSDRANGGDGIDAFSAQFDAGANNTVLSPTLTSIENWTLTDFGAPGGGATTFSAINATGLASITSANSTDDAVTVTNVNSLVNLGVTNTTADFLVTLIAPGTNGNADTSVFTVNGARAGCTVTITTPVNGIETLDIVSQGSAANVLDALTQATGTTLTRVNVSGAQSLTITGALNTTLTTVNASMATGATNLSLAGNGLAVTYTGGSGNDTVNFAGGYTATDVINGGSGVNTLGLNSAQAVAATTQQSNVSNIQAIQIVDSLNGTVDVTKFGAAAATAATDATLDTTAAATALLGGNSMITLGTGNRTITLNNDDTGANTLNVVVSGAGTADVLTVNLQNSDLGAATTFTGAESVNIVSGNGSDGTAADGNANTGTALTLVPTFGAGTLNFSGSVAVTLTGAVSAATINAGSLLAALTMGAESTAGGGATITGSAFNDILFGSANSDSISGGDGNDKIVGRAAGDSIIGGTGTDTIQYQQTTDGGAANADNVGMDLINGFVVGSGGDILAFQDNIFFTDGHTLDLDIITGAAAGNVVTGLTDGGAATAQVIVQTTPLTNFAAVATLFTTIDGAITTADAIVIAEVTGVGTFVFWDGATGTADGEQVLGQLVGVTGANLAGVVAANLAINDG
jgi:hypothetical protein